MQTIMNENAECRSNRLCGQQGRLTNELQELSS
jgi:hypothetical protein